MGRAKEVKFYNGRYCGNMSEAQCDILDSLIEADEQNGCIYDLKHIIYDMNKGDVQDMIEQYETFGMPLQDFEKPYGELMDYQTLSVCFMYYAQRCILGDSVGLGKTVSTAGVLNLLKRERAKIGKGHRYLVLTQKTIAPQLREELVRFTGDYIQLLSSGEQKEIQKFVDRNPYTDDLEYDVVGTHALLTAKGFIQWLELCRTQGKGFPFDTLVIDESSDICGPQISQGFMILSRYFSNIYFLNATPFESSLDVFYKQLNMLDPTFLPTKTNFQKEYCVWDYRGMYPRATGKYKHQKEFKRLVGYRYFARTRRDKGAVMEDCEGHLVLSSLSQAQKELLKKSQLKRMIFDCPSYIDSSIEFNSVNVPKLASLKGLFEDQCADADSIIIFVQFKESQYKLAEWLSSQGYSHAILNGDTPNDERQNIVNRFKNKDFRVLITNVQRGLNFGDCNHCIFYSYDPNPSHMIQFEGRITRDFDIVGKKIYVLCSLGEEYRTLRTTLKQRAKATTDFTNTDFSVILDMLLRSEMNDYDKAKQSDD